MVIFLPIRKKKFWTHLVVNFSIYKFLKFIKMILINIFKTLIIIFIICLFSLLYFIKLKILLSKLYI